MLHDESDGTFVLDVPEAVGSDDGGEDSEVDVSSDEEDSGDEGEEEDDADEDASPKRCALSLGNRSTKP